jgi:hypothetical protein
MEKQITIGQVKQIAQLVAKKFDFVNHGTHYNIIDKKTRQSSNQGGKRNFVYGDFANLVEFEYLNLISENGLYFDWFIHGVDISQNRKSYVYRIEYKIVELLCGFKQEAKVF